MKTPGTCPCQRAYFGGRIQPVNREATAAALRELWAADEAKEDVEVRRSAPKARRAAYNSLLLAGLAMLVRQEPGARVFRLTERGRDLQKGYEEKDSTKGDELGAATLVNDGWRHWTRRDWPNGRTGEGWTRRDADGGVWAIHPAYKHGLWYLTSVSAAQGRKTHSSFRTPTEAARAVGGLHDASAFGARRDSIKIIEKYRVPHIMQTRGVSEAEARKIAFDPKYSGATGYARDQRGRIISYAQAHEREKAAAKESGHLFAYHSKGDDGRPVLTSWSGLPFTEARGVRVLSRSPNRGWVSSERVFMRFRAPWDDGRIWSGFTMGEGMYGRFKRIQGDALGMSEDAYLDFDPKGRDQSFRGLSEDTKLDFVPGEEEAFGGFSEDNYLDFDPAGRDQSFAGKKKKAKKKKKPTGKKGKTPPKGKAPKGKDGKPIPKKKGKDGKSCLAKFTAKLNGVVLGKFCTKKEALAAIEKEKARLKKVGAPPSTTAPAVPVPVAVPLPPSEGGGGGGGGGGGDDGGGGGGEDEDTGTEEEVVEEEIVEETTEAPFGGLDDNAGVVYAWKNGAPGVNGRGSLHTDGHNLYSYRLKIGTTQKGQKVVLDYRAPDNFRSMTTSQHVSLAAKRADRVVAP